MKYYTSKKTGETKMYKLTPEQKLRYRKKAIEYRKTHRLQHCINQRKWRLTTKGVSYEKHRAEKLANEHLLLRNKIIEADRMFYEFAPIDFSYYANMGMIQ